jgi:hypothetical protein
MANDVLLPPWVTVANLRTSYVDNTGMTRGLYTGAPETTSFGGDRLRLSLEFPPKLSSETDLAVERAALRSFLARLRGRQNRAYLWDPSYSGPRGALDALCFELLQNNTFSNGTTNWSSNNSDTVISATNRVLRLKRARNTDTPTVLGTSPTAAVLYAPYVARAFMYPGRGPTLWDIRIRDISDSAAVYATSSTSQTAGGMLTCAGVARDTDITIGIIDRNTGKVAGDYMDIVYASVARCALADSGTNLLLQSDEFDTAWAVTRASIDDQSAGTTAPDGTSTADALHEDATAANSHYVEQTSITVSASTTLDFSFACALKAANRTWGSLSIFEATGSTELGADFNLSTGAAGTTRAGANWSNVRSFISSLGNGWYYCCVVGRKTNAATSLTARVWVGEGDNDRTFDGLNQDSIYLWRATLAQSGVPTRLVQTTAAASTGTSQTGSALYVKGLPASTAALLLPDDRFEVITDRGSELKIVTASLDSDAAGLGYLQFEPPLRGVPADNAAIIVHQPMTKTIFAGDLVGWDDEPGIITHASAEFEEV